MAFVVHAVPMIGNAVDYNPITKQWLEFYINPHTQTRQLLGTIFPYLGMDGLYHFVSRFSGLEIVYPMTPVFLQQVVQRTVIQMTCQMQSHPPPAVHVQPNNDNLLVERLIQASNSVTERLKSRTGGKEEFSEEMLFQYARKMACGTKSVEPIMPPKPSSNFKRRCMDLKKVSTFIHCLNTMAREKRVDDPISITPSFRWAAREAFSTFKNFLADWEMGEDDFLRWHKVTETLCTNPQAQIWTVTSDIYDDTNDKVLKLTKFSPEEEVMLDYFSKMMRKADEEWSVAKAKLDQDKMSFIQSAFKIDTSIFGWENSTYADTGDCVPIRIALDLELPSELDTESLIEDVNGKQWKTVDIVKAVVERLLASSKTLETNARDFWLFVSNIPAQETLVAPSVARLIAHTNSLIQSYHGSIDWKKGPRIRFQWTDEYPRGNVNLSVLKKTSTTYNVPMEELKDLIHAVTEFIEVKQPKKNIVLCDLDLFLSVCLCKLCMFGVLRLDVYTQDMCQDLGKQMYMSLRFDQGEANGPSYDYFVGHLLRAILQKFQQSWPFQYLLERSKIGLLLTHVQSTRDFCSLMMNKALLVEAKDKSIMIFAACHKKELILKAYSSNGVEVELVTTGGEPFTRFNLDTVGCLSSLRTLFNAVVFKLRNTRKVKVELCVLVDDSKEGLMTQCIVGDSVSFPNVDGIYTVFTRHIIPYLYSAELEKQVGQEDEAMRIVYLMKMMISAPVAYCSFMLTATRSQPEVESTPLLFDLAPPLLEWNKILEQAYLKEFIWSYTLVGISRTKISIKRLLSCPAQRAALKMLLGKNDYSFQAINMLLDEMNQLDQRSQELMAMLPKEVVLKSMGLSPTDITNYSHFFLMDVSTEVQENLYINAFVPEKKRLDFLKMIQDVEEILNANQASSSNGRVLLMDDSYAGQASRASNILQKILDNASVEFENNVLAEMAKNFDNDVLLRTEPSTRDARSFVGLVYQDKDVHHRCSSLWNLFDLRCAKFGFRHVRTTDALKAFVKCYDMKVSKELQMVLDGTSPSKDLMNDLLREQFYSTFINTLIFHPARHQGLFLKPAKPYCSTAVSSILKQPFTGSNAPTNEDLSCSLLKMAFIKPLTSELLTVDWDKGSEVDYFISGRRVALYNIYLNRGSKYFFDDAKTFSNFLKASREKGFTTQNCVMALTFPEECLQEHNLVEDLLQVSLLNASSAGGFPVHLSRTKTETGITSRLGDFKRKKK